MQDFAVVARANVARAGERNHEVVSSRAEPGPQGRENSLSLGGIVVRTRNVARLAVLSEFEMLGTSPRIDIAEDQSSFRIFGRRRKPKGLCVRGRLFDKLA